LVNQLSTSQNTPGFPVNLLAAGYGTALLGALLLYALGGGILATVLTFWLGGAVAVLFWGYVWASSRKIVQARSRRPVEFPPVLQALVSEK
jgi:hypothetical protein